MIYSIDIKNFPESGQYIECNSYKDENDFEWKIATVKNGFFMAYFGDDYFKSSYFDLKVNDEIILINNTGCFFIQDKEFDTFYEFRNLLKNGYTDDIWDSINMFLTLRLTSDGKLMESERIKL